VISAHGLYCVLQWATIIDAAPRLDGQLIWGRFFGRERCARRWVVRGVPMDRAVKVFNDREGIVAEGLRY
jgi:hypothetical protein